MDIRNLEFASGSFDKVLCIHVMDFVEEDVKATGEILRVLKNGGQFVITYPSRKEGLRLGINLLKGGFLRSMNPEKDRIRACAESLAQIVAGVIYLPLVFRPKRKSYSRNQLKAVVSQFNTVDLQIEEDTVYQDFIVHGRK